MPPARRGGSDIAGSIPKTSVASSGPVPVPITSRIAYPSQSHGGSSSQQPQQGQQQNQQQSSQQQSGYPEDSTLQQTTTTTPNGGTVTLVNTQPGNGSDILISASESANIISIHLINGKTLRIVWENAGPALNNSA